MDSSTVLHFQHLILTPSIYVGVWLDICVSQMARLVWIVLAYSPRDGGWVRMGGRVDLMTDNRSVPRMDTSTDLHFQHFILTAKMRI